MNNLQRSGDLSPLAGRIIQLEQDEQRRRHLSAPPMTPPRNQQQIRQISMASQTTPSLGRQGNNLRPAAGFQFQPNATSTPTNANSIGPSLLGQYPGEPSLLGPYRGPASLLGPYPPTATHLSPLTMTPPPRTNNMMVLRPPTPHPNYNWANDSIIGRNHPIPSTPANVGSNRVSRFSPISQGQELVLSSSRRHQNNVPSSITQTPMGQLYNSNGTSLLLYDTDNSRSPTSSISSSTSSYCQCESCRRIIGPNRDRGSESFSSSSSTSSYSSGGIHVIMVCRRHCPFCTPRGFTL